MPSHQVWYTSVQPGVHLSDSPGGSHTRALVPPLPATVSNLVGLKTHARNGFCVWCLGGRQCTHSPGKAQKRRIDDPLNMTPPIFSDQSGISPLPLFGMMLRIVCAARRSFMKLQPQSWPAPWQNSGQRFHGISGSSLSSNWCMMTPIESRSLLGRPVRNRVFSRSTTAPPGGGTEGEGGGGGGQGETAGGDGGGGGPGGLGDCRGGFGEGEGDDALPCT